MVNKKHVLKSKTKKVYKHNKLNKANFGDFNLNDYRVYLNTIALLGGVDAKGKYLQSENLTREYVLSAKEFSKQFDVDLKSSYRVLKNAVDKLMKTCITLQKPDLLEVWKINICEMAKYNETSGTITVLFTNSIMEYLIQKTKNFTLYNLKEVAGLTSIYAVRVYELMQQWSTTTGTIIHTVEQWRYILSISPNQYKFYNNLKRKVFLQALEEINNKTCYHLTMTEEKEGRKVVRVKFDFAPDTIHSGYDKDGQFRSRHIKPRKKKSESPIKNSNPDVHPEQQELDLK